MHKICRYINFQGISIAVETDRGDVRYWRDPNNNTTGQTKMKYPYGYFVDTIGLDGDEVDVYVGDDEKSTRVFVVTQMSAPLFIDIDEQKVMVGFNSAEQAKKAYMEHYTDPRFFGYMTEVTIYKLKKQLSRYSAGLIKNLLSAEGSHDIMGKERISMQDPRDILKALSAAVAQGMTRREQLDAAYQAGRALGQLNSVRAAEPVFVSPQDFGIGIGVDRLRPHYEPPTIPVRRVETPNQHHGEWIEPTYKSASAWEDCEAVPFHKRKI